MGDEVRVEQWMVEAAAEIEPNDSPVVFEREMGAERIQRIAEIIARHAPRPLFRPGETVQYRHQPHVRGVIVEQADQWTVNWGTRVATYAGRYLEPVEATDD